MRFVHYNILWSEFHLKYGDLETISCLSALPKLGIACQPTKFRRSCDVTNSASVKIGSTALRKVFSYFANSLLRAVPKTSPMCCTFHLPDVGANLALTMVSLLPFSTIRATPLKNFVLLGEYIKTSPFSK
jgi:hypothetical protein